VETLAPKGGGSVVGLADVAGIFDVRAAVDPAAGTGRAELVDGTIFDMSLGQGAVALPSAIPAAMDEASLATCDACGLIAPAAGGATRVRISSAGANDGALQAGALTLHHHAVGPVRVRWDVVVVAP
jgi:hypothetical protein